MIRVGKTRVTLDRMVAAFQRGDTPEEIARNYDALSLGEVYQTIGYYLAHQTELDASTWNAARHPPVPRHPPQSLEDSGEIVHAR